jgi:hypothetical protein
MIKEVTEEALGEYEDKKTFLALMSKKYEALQAKIWEYEAFDSLQREEGHWKLTLEKRHYEIPTILIPPTLSSEDPEEEESEEEESDGSSGLERSLSVHSKSKGLETGESKNRGVRHDTEVSVEQDQSEAGDRRGLTKAITLTAKIPKKLAKNQNLKPHQHSPGVVCEEEVCDSEG